MGTYEISQRIGISRQRVHQLADQPGFPEPVDVLQSGRVWLEEEVEAWISAHRAR
jgi:predicted DNA-binding transcriptional regulator AlpA